jgi:hypothetical protein
MAMRSGRWRDRAMVAQELHVLPHPSSGGWVVGTRWYATAHEAQTPDRRLSSVCGVSLPFTRTRLSVK